MRDDIYRRAGTIWRRQWTGDRYEWTSVDGRLVAWCSARRFVGGKPVHEYSATLDGYASTRVWPTLTDCMDAAVKSRDALDRRAAA